MENYDTVLDRIYIRIQTKDGWESLPLAECLQDYPDAVNEWLSYYLFTRMTGCKPDQPLDGSSLEEVIRLLDQLGIGPARLKSK